MSKRVSTITAGLAIVLALATTAQGKSYYDSLVEDACNDIRTARTPQDLATIQAQHAGRVAADLKFSRDTAKPDYTTLMRDLFINANKERVAADVELATLIGFAAPTTADLQQAVVDAQQEVRKIEGWGGERDQLQKSLDDLLLATLKVPDWRKLADDYRKQIADKQKDIDAKMPAAQTRLTNATARHKGRLDRIAELRRDLPRLNDNEAVFLRNLNDAIRQQAAALGDIAVLEDVEKRVANCVEAQRRAFNPSPQDSAWQAKLADLEKAIAAAERRVPAVTRACRETEEQLNATRASVARLQGQAATILTQATAQQVRAAATATQAAAAGRQALTDIASAVAAVTASRARVAQLSQAACQGARLYQGDPKGANAPGALAEAFRNRALAENEVLQSAIALQTIRSTHATALASAAPAAGPLDLDSGRQQLGAVKKAILDLLDTPAQLHERRRGGQFHFYVVLGIGGDLEAFTKADPRSPIGLFATAQAPAINALVERHAKLLPDCSTPLGARINALDGEIAAALAKANEATGAIWALAPPPALTNNVHLIEAIYTHARGIADGTAADALNAMRCVAETQTAIITAPPPPPVAPPTAGIKCRYTRPGGQVIEVELFDVATCPPEIPARFVGSAPATQTDMEKDFGDKAHDFTGKWVDQRDQFWTFTIANGKASRFPIAAQSVYRGSDNQLSKWTGTCIRTEANKAVCEGKGTFENDLRVMSYSVKITMYVHLAEGRLAYNGEYTHTQLVSMKVPGMKPTPGNISTGWKVIQSLKKE